MSRLAACLLICLSAFAAKKVIVVDGAAPSSSPLSAAVETEHLVYVSGMLGRDAKGAFARGDVAAQVRQTLDNIGQALKAAGLGFGHVVGTTLYLTDLRTLPQADEVYRKYFPKDFPARTTLESQLMTPEGLVEISAIAIRDISRKRFIHPEGWANPVAPVSYAVEAGDTLFLSALQPVDAATGALAGDSIQSQTERVMRNQEEILRAAKMTFGDLVFSRIYLTDPGDYAGLNEVYRKFVTAPPPARATVHGFPDEPGRLLQVQSTAVRGSGKGRPTGEGHTSPIHSFSVKASATLYITGMTGRTPEGSLAKNDIRAQTRQALKTIEEQLTKHGMTFADAVDCVVWLQDARHFTGMNEVYREVVKPNPPARATVRIAPASAAALIEIMMIASK